jgi:multidrug resistance efflux pump
MDEVQEILRLANPVSRSTVMAKYILLTIVVLIIVIVIAIWTLKEPYAGTNYTADRLFGVMPRIRRY